MLVPVRTHASTTKVADGLYISRTFNFELEIGLGQRDMEANYPKFGDYDPNSYGVCDSPDQFMEKYGNVLRDDPRNLVVAFVSIRKSTQYPEGGWRWHKWGPYVGKQTPTCEYLYDEPLIKEVFTYQILAVPDSLVAK